MTDEDLKALANDQIAPPQRAPLLTHINGCPECELRWKLEVSSITASAAQSLALPPPAPPSDWVPPTVIDKLRIKEQLGEGTMGRVYRAVDPEAEREVAIKFLNDKGMDETRKQYLTEVKALGRMNHENVVTMYYYGERDGHFYVVSELVSGKALDKLKLPLPWWEVLNIGVGAARALAAAHSSNVLHRDVKPANLMRTESGKVKLLDFGLAKNLNQPHSPVSRAAAAPPSLPGYSRGDVLVGTPLYMARELWQEEAPTRRSDVYALGAVLYELCSGRPPYPASTMQELVQAVQTHPVEPLRDRVPRVPPLFAALIDRCLHVDPQQRPADGVQLALLLEQVRQRLLDPPPRFPLSRVALLTLVVGMVVGASVMLARWLLAPARPAPPHLIRLEGGLARLGSSADESAGLLVQCRSESPERCSLQHLEGENPAHDVQLTPFEIADREQSTDAFAAWLSGKIKQGLVRARLHRHPRDSIIDPYLYLGDYPVLNLFQSHMLENGFPMNLAPGGERIVVKEGGARLPVSQVTWYGAQLFCQEQGLRLPTEAEWEFAARGSQRRRFPWGNEQARCEEVQWARTTQRSMPGCRGDGWELSRRFLDPPLLYELLNTTAAMPKEFAAPPQPCPEPSYQSTPQACSHLGRRLVEVDQVNRDRTREGVTHLAGNVSEWVLDAFEAYPSCRQGPCVDPVVVGDVRQRDADRVYRGGDVGFVASMSRGASRQHYRADTGLLRVGFRCAAKVDRQNDPLLRLLDPSQTLKN